MEFITSRTIIFSDLSSHIEEFIVPGKMKSIVPVDKRTHLSPANNTIELRHTGFSYNGDKTLVKVWVNPDPNSIDDDWTRLTPACYDSSKTHNSFWAKIA